MMVQKTKNKKQGDDDVVSVYDVTSSEAPEIPIPKPRVCSIMYSYTLCVHVPYREPVPITQQHIQL
jgi:hypothetical protein